MNYTIKYVDNIKDGFGGKCYYPPFPKFGTCRIEIDKKYLKDDGLLNHEIKHAQQYKDNFFHSLRYRFSKEYRYSCELEAYSEQIKAYRYTRIEQASWIILALLDKYDLSYSVDKITEDIEKIIKG